MAIKRLSAFAGQSKAELAWLCAELTEVYSVYLRKIRLQ
jgi:hypothetical protein